MGAPKRIAPEVVFNPRPVERGQKQREEAKRTTVVSHRPEGRGKTLPGAVRPEPAKKLPPVATGQDHHNTVRRGAAQSHLPVVVHQDRLVTKREASKNLRPVGKGLVRRNKNNGEMTHRRDARRK